MHSNMYFNIGTMLYKLVLWVSNNRCDVFTLLLYEGSFYECKNVLSHG